MQKAVRSCWLSFIRFEGKWWGGLYNYFWGGDYDHLGPYSDFSVAQWLLRVSFWAREPRGH